MKTKPLSSIAQLVLAETLLAYADASGKHSDADGYRLRNLNFRASAAVSRDEAIAIMREACPSYNEFKPSILRGLPPDARVTLAREGSVCVYVAGALYFKTSDFKADESGYNADTGESRLWWD